MRSALFAATLLAASAVAQRATVPLAAGGSAVVQVTTDADGDPTTRTLSTIRSTTATTAEDTETTAADEEAAGGGGGGGRKGIQAPPTGTPLPMSVTTYEIEGHQYVWSNSFQSPAEATVLVSEGVIQNGNSYISSAQSDRATMEDQAMKTYKPNGNSRSGGMKTTSWGATAGWTSMVLGMGAAIFLL